MVMISKEAMESVMSLKEKIADPERKAECIADVENMIEIKQSHLERAEWGSCCGSICNLASQIDNELQMLQNILSVLSGEDSTRAAFLLEDYIAFLQENYTTEPEHW